MRKLTLLILLLPILALAQMNLNNNTVQVSAAGTITSGVATAVDPIVITPNAKGTTAYTGTITTTGDLTANRTWELTDYNGIMWTTGTRFNRPHLIVATDWTAIDLGNGDTNYIVGSSLGPITYRELGAKTTRSWVEGKAGLNLDADATVNNEGVEIFFADGVGATLGDGWIVTGTTGGIFEVTFTIGDVSACDQLMIGWRACAAFNSSNDYTAYSDWSAIGIKGVDGSIWAEGEVGGGGTLSDDTGVDITDGTTHILRMAINATTRVPSATLDGVAITLTNSGTAKTNDIAMAPFITYIHADEVADPNLIINRISVWR